MLDVSRSRLEASEGYHYRPQLNPEFARRARENNRKRREEEEKRRKIADAERQRQLEQEAKMAVKAERAKAAANAEVRARKYVEDSTPQVSRSEFQRVLDRLLPVFGVTLTEVRSAKRSNRLVLARQAIAYWASRRTLLSQPQIGRLLSRDHSTIFYSRQAYPAKRAAMGRHLKEIQVGPPSEDVESMRKTVWCLEREIKRRTQHQAGAGA